MYEIEYDSFAKFIRDEPIPLFYYLILIFDSLLAIIEMCLRYIPGGFGYKLRYYYYKITLKHIGRNVLIDTDVSIVGPKNISLGDFVWIDSGCRLEAMLGKITIGKRVHVAPYTIIAAREPVTIHDYVGISSGVKIYANSEHPLNGKRMSGPMVPEEYKAFRSEPIILEKDSFVGANSVLLPGAYLGEGAVVGANTVVKKRVEPYTIVAGAPARLIGTRDRVTVPDL